MTCSSGTNVRVMEDQAGTAKQMCALAEQNICASLKGRQNFLIYGPFVPLGPTRGATLVRVCKTAVPHQNMCQFDMYATRIQAIINNSFIHDFLGEYLVV